MRALGVLLVISVAACSGGGGGSGGGSGGSAGAGGGSAGAGGGSAGAGGGSAGAGGGSAGAGGGSAGAGGGSAGAGGGSAGAGGADAGLANIQSALNCGTPVGLVGIGQPGQLQVHQIDTTTFPNALCNDGSPPVLHYRPYVGAANRNRWVIGLNGGGVCYRPDDCAARWCACNTATRCPYASELTGFTFNNMSGGGPRGDPGNGILSRDAGLLADGGEANPLANYNHVLLTYCSSDGWNGNARSVAFNTTHPITGQPVAFTLHFLGTQVLEADLRVLRQDGVTPLNYTLNGGAVPMPDLDDATEVIVAGDSAGGAGVIYNLDWISGELRARHNGCDGGAACPPATFGLIDAAIGPEFRRLDFSTYRFADAGINTYDKFVGALGRSPAVSGRGDVSCSARHAGDAGLCADMTHIVRHHLTTPYLVRMALLDKLISRVYEQNEFQDPNLGPFVFTDAGVPRTFSVVLRAELQGFPNQPSTAEEGAQMTLAPGVFAPACVKHDTIHVNDEVYGVTVAPAGLGPQRLFDVYRNWRSGNSPSSVLTSSPTLADTVCVP